VHEKELPPPLDAALSQVDPERRRLLGILLAGAAALPLLNSTTLGAQQKPAAQSTNQSTRPIKHTPTDLKANSGAIKNDTQIKGDRTIKMDSQIKSNAATKNATWVKGGVTTNDSSQIKADSSQIKTGATIKSTAPIKSSTGAMKTDNAHIKSSGTPQQ
jgi:hypothetical protein